MYRHTQVGWVILISVLVLVLAEGTILLFMLPPETRLGTLIAVGAFTLLILLFASLTVTVDSASIRLAFGPGLIHRTIQLGDVASAEPFGTKWWYGFGIRLSPHGWLWNVSGLKAVKLTYKNGKAFLIGTDDPEGLTRAINAGLGR